jgi:hypothetical protein
LEDGLDKNKFDDEVDYEYKEQLIPGNLLADGACQRSEIIKIPSGMYNSVNGINIFLF